MRKSLVLATLFVLVCSAAALAGVPDPARSSVALSPANVGCQYVFRADGNVTDQLTLFVTLRDAFDAPVPACLTSVAMVNPSLNAGTCCPAQLTTNTLTGNGMTNANGVAFFVLNTVNGRGTVDLDVVAQCSGNILIASPNIAFTSSDQNASGGVPFSTNIVDIGLFSACFPPGGAYCQGSDFDCNGSVNIVDFGLFSGGLPLGCASGACP